MYDPYHDTYNPALQDQHNHVLSDYSFAITQLQSVSAPATTYIDLYWDGSGVIYRLWDMTDMSTLSDTERFKYFDHLRGLYRKAMENLFYP